MTEASAPVTRESNHKRTITYESFKRSDGLWDIEVRLQDQKAYDYHDLERGEMPAGGYVHNIGATVTIDNDMVVHAVTPDMRDVPYGYCRNSTAGLENLIGAKLSEGWRRTLQEHLGRTRGCTHMREMLFGVATVAFQTISAEAERPENRGKVPFIGGDTPYYVGGCFSLAFDSPVVARYYAEFAPKSDDTA